MRPICGGRGRWRSAAAELVRRNAEVPELELLVLADEHVERSEVAVQRLAAVQRVERLENGGDLAPNESLRLRSLRRQPGPEVAVLGVLHREAVTHPQAVDDGKAIEDS